MATGFPFSRGRYSVLPALFPLFPVSCSATCAYPHRAACILCVYLTWPHPTLWHLPVGPFLASCTGCSYPLSRCLLARCCVYSGCVFMYFLLWSFFCAHPVGPPPLYLCVSVPCPVISCCFFFFYPPLCMHARHHCTCWSSGYGSPLFSSLFLSPPRAFPLAVPGRARRAPLPRVILSPLPSPPYPRRLSLARPPYCCFPAPVCAALLLSAPGLYLARPHASLRLHPVLRPVPVFGRPPQVLLPGISPVICPRRPPLHQFPEGEAGRPVRLNAGHWYGVSLWAMWCTYLPLFTPCAAPSALGHVPRPRRLLPLCASQAALVAAHARPACVPCSPLLYHSPAALTPPSLPRHPSSTYHLTVFQPFVTRRGVACRSPSGYYRLLSLPVLYTLPSSQLPGSTYASDAPALPPGVRSYAEASCPSPPMWACAVWHDFAVWPTEPPA